MGIGVQGKPSGEVAEHTRHGLDIYTILERDGCEGVAEVMESDLWDTCPCQYSLEHIVDAVRRDWSSVWGREDIHIIGLGLLLFQNFYRLL